MRQFSGKPATRSDCPMIGAAYTKMIKKIKEKRINYINMKILHS
jgi:hypothetical protein